jgi:hypothetical protein
MFQGNVLPDLQDSCVGIFYSEDGGSTFLRNVDKHLPRYVTLHTKSTLYNSSCDSCIFILCAVFRLIVVLFVCCVLL